MDELSSIKKRLKEFEKKLYGSNYECHFSFEKIFNSIDIPLAIKIIEKQFKLSNQIKQHLNLIEYDKFITTISRSLQYRGDRSHGVIMTIKQEAEFKKKLKEFNQLIKQKFAPSQSQIYIFPELTTWIFWGFCFLVVSKERNAIYLFEGVVSD